MFWIHKMGAMLAGVTLLAATLACGSAAPATPTPSSPAAVFRSISSSTLQSRSSLSTREMLYLVQVAGYIETLYDETDSFLKELKGTVSLQTASSIIEHAQAIQRVHQDLEEMDPPSGWVEFHVALLDATGDCDEAMLHLEMGLVTGDKSEASQVVNLMNSCFAKMARPTRILERKLQD